MITKAAIVTARVEKRAFEPEETAAGSAVDPVVPAAAAAAFVVPAAAPAAGDAAAPAPAAGAAAAPAAGDAAAGAAAAAPAAGAAAAPAAGAPAAGAAAPDPATAAAVGAHGQSTTEITCNVVVFPPITVVSNPPGATGAAVPGRAAYPIVDVTVRVFVVRAPLKRTWTLTTMLILTMTLTLRMVVVTETVDVWPGATVAPPVGVEVVVPFVGAMVALPKTGVPTTATALLDDDDCAAERPAKIEAAAKRVLMNFMMRKRVCLDFLDRALGYLIVR